jgi:hypothetical protein
VYTKEKHMREQRKGISTILGALFFISIMFSAIVPMQLVMQQADNIRERKIHDSNNLDLLRKNEQIEVYPIPHLTLDLLNVSIINLSEYPVHFERVWVNDTSYTVDVTANSLETVTIGDLPLSPLEGGVYEVRIITERGNVFVSEIGAISYSGGEWISETFGFRFIFPSRPGKGARGNDWLNEVRVSISQGGEYVYSNYTMYWAISASEGFFELDASGAYDIDVYIWCRNPNRWDQIYDVQHSITYPDGDPIIELKYAIDGEELVLE